MKLKFQGIQHKIQSTSQQSTIPSCTVTPKKNQRCDENQYDRISLLNKERRKDRQYFKTQQLYEYKNTNTTLLSIPYRGISLDTKKDTVIHVNQLSTRLGGMQTLCNI